MNLIFIGNEKYLNKERIKKYVLIVINTIMDEKIINKDFTI